MAEAIFEPLRPAEPEKNPTTEFLIDVRKIRLEMTNAANVERKPEDVTDEEVEEKVKGMNWKEKIDIVINRIKKQRNKINRPIIDDEFLKYRTLINLAIIIGDKASSERKE